MKNKIKRWLIALFLCSRLVFCIRALAAGNLVQVLIRPKAIYSMAALSPSGKLLAYVSDDGSIQTRRDEINRTLLKETPTGETYFYSLSFSPDGKTLYFAASFSVYEPSTIYSMWIDGSHLTKITHLGSNPSKSGDQPMVNIRYYSAVYPSPDGTKLLFLVFYGPKDVAAVALSKPDGSELMVVADGRPIGWDTSSSKIYLTDVGISTLDATNFSLVQGDTTTIAILGLSPTNTIYSVSSDVHVTERHFDQTPPTFTSVPAFFQSPSDEYFTLIKIQATASDTFLLRYQSKTKDDYEELRLFGKELGPVEQPRP